MVKHYKHDHIGVPITNNDGETLNEFMILSELRCKILDSIKSNDVSVRLPRSVEPNRTLPIMIDGLKVVERKEVI